MRPDALDAAGVLARNSPIFSVVRVVVEQFRNFSLKWILYDRWKDLINYIFFDLTF